MIQPQLFHTVRHMNWHLYAMLNFVWEDFITGALSLEGMHTL